MLEKEQDNLYPEAAEEPSISLPRVNSERWKNILTFGLPILTTLILIVPVFMNFRVGDYRMMLVSLAAALGAGYSLLRSIESFYSKK